MARKVNRYEKNHPKNRHHHSMREGLQDEKKIEKPDQLPVLSCPVSGLQMQRDFKRLLPSFPYYDGLHLQMVSQSEPFPFKVAIAIYFCPKMRCVSNIKYFLESLPVTVISLATLFLDHWSWLVRGMWKNSQALSKNLLTTVGRA